MLASPTRRHFLVAIVLALAAPACGGRPAASPTPATTAPVDRTTPVLTVPTTNEAPTTTAAPTTVAPPRTTTSATTASARPTTTGEPATVVTGGATGRRIVALTFDAGADVGFAARILDVLKSEGVHATFGITGRWAEQQPDLVRRMTDEGHLLMNHTYDHRSWTGVSATPAVLSGADRRAEVEHTEEIIRNLTGRSTQPWFRPPYGDYDASVNAAVGALGYRYNVLWTVDSLGWQGLSPAAIVNRCLGGAAPGAILLFHVGAQSQDAAALPDVIVGLRTAGYTFGTVADVIGA